MFLKIKNLFKNKIVLGSFIVTLSSIFTNFLAYLFQLVMGRALSVSEYGVLIAFFSLQSILTLPTGIIANSVTKTVTEIKNDDYPNGLSLFFYSLLKLNLAFSLVIVILMYLFKDFIFSYLNISDTTLFLPFLFYVFISILFIYDKSFLQGLHRYKAFSLVGFLHVLGKLFTALIVLYYSLNLLWVFILLALFILLFEAFSLYLLFKNINKKVGLFSTKHLGKILRFSFFSSFGFLGITLIFNNDILLVKHLFNAEIAGFYSSSAVMGRMVFYGASPIATVLFPICAERYHQKKGYLDVMFKGLTAVFLMSLAGFIVFYFFPEYIIKLMFGDKYLGSAQYLPLYSLYMLFYSVTAVFTWLLVSVSRLKLVSITLLGAFIQYISIKFIFNQNVSQVLYTSIAVCAGILGVYVLSFIKEFYLVKK